MPTVATLSTSSSIGRVVVVVGAGIVVVVVVVGTGSVVDVDTIGDMADVVGAVSPEVQAPTRRTAAIVPVTRAVARGLRWIIGSSFAGTGGYRIGTQTYDSYASASWALRNS